MTSKAQPGILDFVFRSFTNDIQTITTNNYQGEIVSILVVDEMDNNIVYETKTYVAKSTNDKLVCELPKGMYKLIFANFKEHIIIEHTVLNLNKILT